MKHILPILHTTKTHNAYIRIKTKALLVATTLITTMLASVASYAQEKTLRDYRLNRTGWAQQPS